MFTYRFGINVGISLYSAALLIFIFISVMRETAEFERFRFKLYPNDLFGIEQDRLLFAFDVVDKRDAVARKGFDRSGPRSFFVLAGLFVFIDVSYHIGAGRARRQREKRARDDEAERYTIDVISH